eukprot:2555327-Rhodomonas_salina.1
MSFQTEVPQGVRWHGSRGTFPVHWRCKIKYEHRHCWYRSHREGGCLRFNSPGAIGVGLS